MFVWANVVVVGWLAVAVALLAVHALFGIPVWVALHALLLGAVTTAIVIWSEHFVVTLCRVPGPPQRRLAIGLVALNLFFVAALIGVATGTEALTGLGGTGIAAIATVHTIHLWRMNKAAPAGRFGYVIGFYAAASLSLVAGAALGVSLALGAGWYARLRAAHVHVMLLGWVGLSAVGTLFTLWPTTTGARITGRTVSYARRALPVLGAGLVLAVGGMVAANVWLTVTGLVCYAAGIAIAVVPLWPVRHPRGPAAWMLAAATSWLGVAVLIDAIRLIIAGSVDAMPEFVADNVMPLLVAGFVAQVLVGALTYLLPVVLSRGSTEHRAIAEALAQGWEMRVLSANIAVPLVAVDWPSPVPQVGWALAAVGVAAFAVLALRVAVPVALRGYYAVESRRERLPGGTTTGVVAGLVAVVFAAAVATTGRQTTDAPTISGEPRTVDVALRGMRIQPDTVEVPAGTRLVLRVTNQDTIPHDLHVDNGQQTPLLRRGETARLDVGPVNTDRQAWCGVAGHRAAGMTMTIRIQDGHEHNPDSENPNGTPALDLAADPSPSWRPRDAALAPATGAVHRIEIRATEQELEVAPGRRERR